MPRDQFGGVSEQTRAGKHRLDDARVLLDAGRWRGAMYMAGYAVECLLKTKLMTRYGCRTLRHLESKLKAQGLLREGETLFDHRLERLLNLARAADRFQSNRGEWRHFIRVNHWNTAWRHDPDPGFAEDARLFLDAVEHALRWIESNI